MKPLFIAVRNRCAVDLRSLELPFADRKAVRILENRGFRVRRLALTETARSLKGSARFVRSCRAEDAPAAVDCSSFVKWVYGEHGIWLPRRPIDQYLHSGEEVAWSANSLREGDLLFTTGRRNLYWRDPTMGIGHVGMVTKDKSVIHASGEMGGVVEISLRECLSRWPQRGAVRIIFQPERTFVTEPPAGKSVESSGALRWNILA